MGIKSNLLAARELVRDATARLERAASGMSELGPKHFATESLMDALRAAKVAGAKLDIVIARAPDPEPESTS